MKVKLNPDKRLVKFIKQALKDNDGYCPSQLVKDKTTKCKCREFREQETEGPCRCGMYVKVKEK